MNTRAAIEEYIRAGHGDRTIARQLGVSRLVVSAARKELGLPAASTGPKRADSIEDLFWRRVQPVEGGHLEWTGYRVATNNVPAIYRDGRLHTAYRIAFRIAHQREPEGRVQTGCEHPGCVHPQHVDDQAMRNQYRAIFGEAA